MTRDWSVRRHRPRPRALGTTRALAAGLGVVGLCAAALTVTNSLGDHTINTHAVVRTTWDLPVLVMTAQPKAPAPSPTASPAPPAPAKMPVDGPTELRISAISVDTKIEPIALDANGVLMPPHYTDVGWYAAGTKPGDMGPAVIAGHYDDTTPNKSSIFYKLSRLKAGDIIKVRRSGAWLTFVVDAVQSFPQSGFPTSLVYGPTPDAELRLVTCGGTYDAVSGAYTDNVVVFATEQASPGGTK